MREPSTPTRPIISVAITAKNSAYREALQQALEDLARQDPTISIETEPDTLQSTVCGMDESHLEMICDRILLENRIAADVGAPKVVYLETIRDQAEAEGKYIRQTGGHGNYGHVKILLEPNERGKGFEFIDAIKGGVVPKQFINPTEQGIRAALLNGVLAGHEMVDFKATLYDGSYHDTDSNDMAFNIAGSMAFKEAARKASPFLLEPIMAIEVSVAEERANATIREISSRRGTVTGRENSAGSQVIYAVAPLAEMLGSANRMRLGKLGAARCSMRLIGYLEKPSHGDSGDNDAGITANKPTGPKPRHGSAADLESD